MIIAAKMFRGLSVPIEATAVLAASLVDDKRQDRDLWPQLAWAAAMFLVAEGTKFRVARW